MNNIRVEIFDENLIVIDQVHLLHGSLVSPIVHCALEASPHRGETDRLEARVDDYGGHVGGVDAQLGLLRLPRSLHGQQWSILLNSG